MSTSFIKLTSLSEKCPQNHCYLLQIDTYSILLNIGAFDLDYTYLEEHKRVIETVDFILVSHFSLDCIGGLPFLSQILYCNPIYMTFPVFRLGKVNIEECCGGFRKKISKRNIDFWNNWEASENIVDNITLVKEIYSEKNENVCKNKKYDDNSFNSNNKDSKTYDPKSEGNNFNISLNSCNFDLNNKNVDSVINISNTDLKTNDSNFNYKNNNTDLDFSQNDNKLITGVTKNPLNLKINSEKTNSSKESVKFNKIDLMKVNSYTKKDIKKSFKSVIHLKYSQPVEISSDLAITAFRSGHSIGGSVWKIKTKTETILFALNINHRKENHVDGIELESFDPPTFIITNTNNKIELVKRIERNKKLESLVLKHDKIYIPISYERLFEFISVIEPLLAKHKFKAVVIGNKIRRFKRKTEKMVEWMGENTLKEFNVKQNKIFEFKDVDFTRKIKDNKYKIILTIDDSLEYPFSKIILKEISKKEKNLILFINDGRKDSIQNKIAIGEKEITAMIPKKVPLSENEKQKLRIKQIKKEKRKNEEKIIDDYLKTREEDEEETKIYMNNKEIAKKMFWHEYKQDLWIDDENRKYACFPEKKIKKYDEYGEAFILRGDYNIENENNNCIKKTEYISKNLTITNEKNNENNINITNIRKNGKLVNHKVIWREKTFKILCSIENLDFSGLSDFQSTKNIMEKLNPQKIIFTGHSAEINQLYQAFYSLNNSFEKIYVLKNELNLSYEANMTYLKINDEFCRKIDFRKIKDQMIGAFVAKIDVSNEEPKIEYMDKLVDVTYSDLKPNELKKMLIENGMRVEVKKNILVVEDEIKIEIHDRKIIIEGDLGETYEHTKKIVFQNIAFLN